MSSSLTLGLLIEKLPTSVVPQPDPPDMPNFDAQAVLRDNINRVINRFFAEGKWIGTITQALITAYTDQYDNKFITLPRHLETCIRGGKLGYRTRAVVNQWFQYLPQGRGIRDPQDNYFGPIEDMGDGFVTYRDLLTPSQLVVGSDKTECSGSYIWIRGKDASGNKIYSTVDGSVVEGIRLDLADGTQTTTETFSEIYAVEKVPTDGNVTISDGTDDLAAYEPGERSISYRRYKVDKDWDSVQGIFKRQFVWAVSDNDPIFPPSIEAIKLGLMALNAEEKADVERGQYYMDKAIQFLNNELKEHNSGQEGVLQVSPWLNRRFINMT